MHPALPPIAAAIIAAIGMARSSTAGADAPRVFVPSPPRAATGGGR